MTSLPPHAFRDLQADAATRGDKTALLELVEGTIRAFARRYGRGMPEECQDDLRAAGRLGALHAAKKYDVSNARGASFNTYASHWIRAYVVREVIFFWGKGRCGTNRATRLFFFRYRRTRRELERRGRANPEAIACAIGIPTQALQDIEAVVCHPDHAWDDPEAPFFTRAKSDVERADASLIAQEDVRALNEALSALDIRSRRVVFARFYEGKTLREVGEEMDLTGERVRQIERKAVLRLRRRLSHVM